MGKIYDQLSIEERVVLQMRLELGVKPATIAVGLGRPVLTIWRELRRNGWVRPKTHPAPGRRVDGWWLSSPRRIPTRLCG